MNLPQRFAVLSVAFMCSNAQASEISLSVPNAHVAFDNGRFRIITDDTTQTPDFWAQRAAQAAAAYDYSAKQQGIALVGHLQDPITLHFVSNTAMQGLFPGAQGLKAVGADDVVADISAVAGPDFAAGCLVHELTHILHNRLGHGGVLTHYLIEGIAQELQRRYDGEFFSSKATYVTSMEKVTPYLATVTADEARHLLSPLSYSPQAVDITHVQSLGCFFVEFLRSRCGGSGYRDYAKRIAQMVGTMPKMKRTDPAWRESYLEVLDRAFNRGTEEAFFAFLSETEHNPQARLARTLFATWLQDPQVRRKLLDQGRGM